jgi:5-formyltetrahydrofolate cyclo-ligase
MPREEDNDRETFASPACSMHEFADELVPAQHDAARTAGAPEPADALPVLARTADGGEPSWPVIKPWRARTRAVLLSRRAAVELRERQRRGESAKQRLLAEVDLAPHRVLGFYWPIRAEIDARDIATRHIEAGGIAALPVIARKNAPVEFWPWTPGMSMRRGFWNIPVPAIGEPVRPDALIIPLVGFDAACFRLGYGGGYYDRTLAALTPLPLRIGIGFADAALATIHPQPHDIPMSVIVTDGAVHRIASEK